MLDRLENLKSGSDKAGWEEPKGPETKSRRQIRKEGRGKVRSKNTEFKSAGGETIDLFSDEEDQEFNEPDASMYMLSKSSRKSAAEMKKFNETADKELKMKGYELLLQAAVRNGDRSLEEEMLGKIRLLLT